MAKAERSALPEGSFYLAIGNRSYPFPSQLALHLACPEQVLGTNLLDIDGLQYRFWADPEQYVGKDALVVLEGGQGNAWMLKILANYFESIHPAGELVVPVAKIPLGPRREVRFLFYRAFGYRGPETKTVKFARSP